jgi:hypothetical protein
MNRLSMMILLMRPKVFEMMVVTAAQTLVEILQTAQPEAAVMVEAAEVGEVAVVCAAVVLAVVEGVRRLRQPRILLLLILMMTARPPTPTATAVAAAIRIPIDASVRA